MIEWIVTSSILIVIVIALRYILRGRISPRILYALWALVLVRLLVPVSFGKTGVSVLNALPEAAERGAAEVQAGEGAFTEASESVGHNGEEAVPEATAETVKPARPTQQAEKPAAPTQTAAEDPTEKPTGNPTENPSGGPGEAQSEKTEGPGAIAAVTDENDGNGERQKAVDIYRILNIVFLIGAAASAAVLLTANLRFGLKLRRSRKPIEAPNSRLPVYISAAIETPCLFGLFRPAIYITPETAENRKTLSHIIAHESAHFIHGDHIFALLRCVCLVLHWYNPLVWIAAMLSSRDSELACDEAAIKALGEDARSEYGKTLIALTNTDKRGLMTSALMLNGGSSARGLKERITMITKKPKTKWFVLAGVLLAAAIAIIITFTGANGKKNGEDGAKDAQTAESPTPEASAEPTPAPEITPAPTETPEPTPAPTPEPPSEEEQRRMIDDAGRIAQKANEVQGFAFDLSSAEIRPWGPGSVLIVLSSSDGDELWCFYDNWESDSGEWTYSYSNFNPGEEGMQKEYDCAYEGLDTVDRNKLYTRSLKETHWELYDEVNGGLKYTVLTREELEQAGVELDGTNEDYVRIAAYCGRLFVEKYVNCSEDNVFRCYEAVCTGATVYSLPFLPGLGTHLSDTVCSAGYVFRPVYPRIFSSEYGDVGVGFADSGEYSGWIGFSSNVHIRKTADGNYEFGFGFSSDGGSSPTNMYPTAYPYEYLAWTMRYWQSGDYDDSLAASWIMRELYCMDWEAFKTEFGEEGCEQLLDGIRRWCIAEAGFNQQLRDMQVIRAALNADGEFRQEMAEVMKLQYANDPEDFEICIAMLYADESAVIWDLLPHPPGDISNVRIIPCESSIFTEEEIMAAINVILEEFNSESWWGCTMVEIGYAGDEATLRYNAARSITDNNGIVLTSTFIAGVNCVDDAIGNATWSDWLWMLIRQDGIWYHVDHGY